MRTRKAPVEEVEMEDEDSETDVSDEEVEGMEVESREESASHPVVVDEEGAEDQEVDIDALVNKTMQRFATSKFHSKSSACSALHSRLISSGKLREKKIVTAKGIIEKQTWRGGNAIEAAQSESALYNSKEQLAAPLKAAKVVRPETVGKGWFDFQPLVIDEKIKRDIKMIQMRNYLDPKRFYKSADKMGKVLHVGTVIQGPSEYFSSRLSRKERKQTIVEEILGDATLKSYSKRKFMEIQVDKNNKKRMFKVKKKGGKR